MKKILLILFAITFIVGCSEVANIEEAKTAVLGTWYETVEYEGWTFYYKYDFQNNGTVNFYSARPDDSNWNFVDETYYTVQEGEYTDTGKKFYAAKLTTGATLIIKTNNKLFNPNSEVFASRSNPL